MLDDTRVRDLSAALAAAVDAGELPGVVTLVAQGDDVRVCAVGVQSLDRGDPMRRDTIFRIASITKPVAAAAMMLLVDDGAIGLDDSIVAWAPELANRRVLRTIASELGDTVPARRDIVVRDVLNSTFGFGSVMAMPDTYPIQRPIRDGNLGGDGMPHLARWPAPDEWMRRLGALPLMYQPGERFLYNASCDLLGVLVARISGMPFGAFLCERLFEPLGMRDTAFSFPPESAERIPTLYAFDAETRSFDVFDSAVASELRVPPAFESGSGGLVSTVDDYYAFQRMLLHGGVAANGTRLMSEGSVREMTRDQLTPEQHAGAEIFFGDHSSWGFGLAVTIREEHPWTAVGRFGWVGGFGTLAYCDPTRDFAGVLFTQRTLDSPEPPAIFEDFWRLAIGCTSGADERI